MHSVAGIAGAQLTVVVPGFVGTCATMPAQVAPTSTTPVEAPLTADTSTDDNAGALLDAKWITA